MCTSSQLAELKGAEQVEISVDLVTLAKLHIDFLKLVNDTPALKDRHVLERAIDRYLNCWLPLASECTRTCKLQPPLDCAWVWHCHKLNPVQYAKDCQQLFGKLVDVPPSVPSEDDDELEEITKSKWSKHYPDEPYQFICPYQRMVEDPQLSKTYVTKNTIDYDLLAAIERQRSFYFQVCRPWMYDESYLLISLARYRQFLFFIRLSIERHKQGGPVPFVVPTYDIDLLWHSHQLCPTAYGVDTVKSLGKVLSHDDTDSDRKAGSKLQTSFADVCEQWLNVYGRVYEHAGSLYRGPEPNVPTPPISVERNTQNLSSRSPYFDGNSQLAGRQTLEVNMVIMGASNLHPTARKDRRSYVYIRITSLQSCSSMRLITFPKECLSNANANVVWNEGCCLEAELSTKGLRLELLSYTTDMHDNGKVGLFKRLWRKTPSTRKSKLLGQVIIKWEQDLLDPGAGLCITQSMPIRPEITEGNPSSLSGNVGQDSGGLSSDGRSPCLQFSVSTTTPSRAPFIFRILQSAGVDGTSAEVGENIPMVDRDTENRWIRGSVVDHTGHERFLIWSRWTEGVQRHADSVERKRPAEIVIDVRQPGLEMQSQSGIMSSQRKVLGSAKEVLPLDRDATCRQWALLDGAVELNISKAVDVPGPFACEIKGCPDGQMRILSGRWLKYETDTKSLNRLDPEENKYSTIVRYSADAPTGKATALINWQCNAVEVMPEENVTLILLIFSATSISMRDMQKGSSTLPVSTSVTRQGSSEDHLGSVLVYQDGLSSRWSGTPSNQDLYWEQSTPAHLFSRWYTC